jgi:hypothetical protein
MNARPSGQQQIRSNDKSPTFNEDRGVVGLLAGARAFEIRKEEQRQVYKQDLNVQTINETPTRDDPLE